MHTYFANLYEIECVSQHYHITLENISIWDITPVKFLLIYLPIILSTWKSKHQIEIDVFILALTIAYTSYIYIFILFGVRLKQTLHVLWRMISSAN